MCAGSYSSTHYSCGWFCTKPLMTAIRVYVRRAGLEQISFNLNQYKSATRTRGVLVQELITYDTACVAHNYDDAQEIVRRFARSAQSFGLKIILRKRICCTNQSLRVVIKVSLYASITNR